MPIERYSRRTCAAAPLSSRSCQSIQRVYPNETLMLLRSTTIIGLVNRLQAVRPEDIREEDGRIQWDKFAKFGEYLSVIPECQAKGAPVLGTVSPVLKAVIEDTPIITDEDVSGSEC